MDMSQYLGVFIEETADHLQSLNENLLALENSADDVEILNEIFRTAHTLKGMAGTMGFNNMQRLTHDMENVLSEIRNGKIHVNSDIVDVLFNCLDALEKYLDEIKESGTDGQEENQAIIDNLNNIINNKVINDVVPRKEEKKEEKIQEDMSIGTLSKEFNFSAPEMESIKKGVADGRRVFYVKVILNKGCVLKSARSFIIFRKLEEFSEIIKSEPSMEEIEEEKFDLSFSIVILTKETPENIIEDLNTVAEVEKIEVENIDTYKLSSDIADAKVSNMSTPLHHDVVSEHTQSDNKNAKATENKSNGDNKAKVKGGNTIRVDIDRLDTLMNLVSELIIAKTRLESVEGNDLGQHYHESVEYLERITTSLHDAVMKVRMVPVEQVFNRFPRTVRDLAKNLNKEIELHIQGEDTELDRIVIDEIGDPLLHLLRNAGDHGLETPAEREQAGKPRKGNVYLRAYQDGNSVVIEVEDDGKGIDIEKVRKKAVERGNYTEEEAAKLTDKEVIDLLFKPSFSTAETITDVSGRGVGLDVVKSKISALGGIIETKTVLGKGSKFTVMLPMTLTIIQALMVMIGKEKYAIPLNTIQTIEDVKKSDIQYVQNKDVILLRDSVIPIINLAEILDVEKVENNEESLTVVIVKKGDSLAGFIVDTLIAQQEIVIRSLGKYLSGIKNITGATILGNGEVALILDTNTLL